MVRTLIDKFASDNSRLAELDPELRTIINFRNFLGFEWDTNTSDPFPPSLHPVLRHLGINYRICVTRATRPRLILEARALWQQKLIQYIPLYEKHIKRGTRVSPGLLLCGYCVHTSFARFKHEIINFIRSYLNSAELRRVSEW